MLCWIGVEYVNVCCCCVSVDRVYDMRMFELLLDAVVLLLLLVLRVRVPRICFFMMCMSLVC